MVRERERGVIDVLPPNDVDIVEFSVQSTVNPAGVETAINIWPRLIDIDCPDIYTTN